MSDFRLQPWPGTIAITAFLAFCSWLISIIKGVSNSSLDILSEANAGMHKLITIAQERMRDKNLFNAFILASFLRSNNY